MRRREFITLLGGAAAAWPIAARAQQAAMPVIGILSAAPPPPTRLPAFHRGLAEYGYVEGRNVAIVYRPAEGEYDRLPALAVELVRQQVAVIVTTGTTPTALAAKSATRTIPIVFLMGTDPIEYGLVSSLARPGGNVTGVTTLVAEVNAKRLDLLHQLVPTASLIALLANPLNFAETREVQRAATILGVRLLILNARNQKEVEAAFATLVEQRAGALLVSGDPTFLTWREQLVALAARNAVPAIYLHRETVEAGGLMSYDSDRLDANRIVGGYTGRILNGEKAADLPVQLPTKFEMVINLKTAKALGLTIPEALLATANKVIE
jgi:putative ABC transport system substrate-binding protein